MCSIGEFPQIGPGSHSLWNVVIFGSWKSPEIWWWSWKSHLDRFVLLWETKPVILYCWWRMISYVNTVNLNENIIAVNNGHRPTSSLFRKSLVICETRSTVIVWNMSSLLCLLPTTTVLRPFVRDYPGEPVPEETLTHPPSWSSSSLYHLLPSTTIHSILPVQFTCLAIFLHNLCPCPLLSTSWSGDLHLKFHTFFSPIFSLLPACFTFLCTDVYFICCIICLIFLSYILFYNRSFYTFCR